jgi:hypothetical protein
MVNCLEHRAMMMIMTLRKKLKEGTYTASEREEMEKRIMELEKDLAIH